LYLKINKIVVQFIAHLHATELY